MGKNKESLMWKVYINNYNTDNIEEVNIIPWIWEDLKEYKKEIKKKLKNGDGNEDIYKWFKDTLKSRLQWQFWGRCEYEIVLTDIFTSIDEEEMKRLIEEYNKKDDIKYWRYVDLNIAKKIDVYQQMMLNYDVFVKYIWDNLDVVKGKYL